MDLNDIRAGVADHDKGRWFTLQDPVSGEPTGIRLKISGPDSATQRRAELEMTDRLAEMAGPDGRISARDRETARLETLAACVLGWSVLEDGQPVPFNTANVLRLLRMAKWVEIQIDNFAGDRAAFRDGGEE